MRKKPRIEDHILRQKVLSRGGGVEIDLTPWGFEGEMMAAYQNYLGGGMLGRVCVNDTIRDLASNVRAQLMYNSRYDELDALGEELKRYFFHLTNPEGTWEEQDYDTNQTLPESGY